LKTRKAKGLSIKDVCSQGGRFVQCRHFADKRDSSDTNVRIFWYKKYGFFEIYGVPARTKGVESVRTFFVGKGEGDSIFRDFVRTSFMDGP